MKCMNRVWKLVPVLMLCVMATACDTYYRYEPTGQDAGHITVSGASYLWDLLFYGFLGGIALLYPVIYKNITHLEIGRRRSFALRAIIGLVAAAFFYNRTYYNLKHKWEVDAKAVREISLYGVQEMQWDNAYRVWTDRRNERDVTKELRIPSPMFQAVGPDNKAVVVRGEEVGSEAFEGFAKLAMDLYFRRDHLWKPPAKEGAQPPSGDTPAAPAPAPEGGPAPAPASSQPAH